MFTRVTLSDFRDAFRSAGRKDQFSYAGLRVIFDYMEELESDLGEPVELDVVAICCDYVEMTPAEIIEAYNVKQWVKGAKLHDYCESISDVIPEDLREFLEYNTVILGKTDDTIVFAQF